MRPPLDNALQSILDTFSGADGGVAYVHLRRALEVIDAQAAESDECAIAVVEIVTRFARLVRAIQPTERKSR